MNTIISPLLILLIVVASSLFLYNTVISSLQPIQSTPSFTPLLVEEYKQEGNLLTLYVRNPSNTSASLPYILVKTKEGITKINLNATIPPNSSQPITVELPSTSSKEIEVSLGGNTSSASTTIQIEPTLGIYWLSGWSYRRPITISSTVDVNDYTVKIELNTSNFDFNKANPDGSDIRFTLDDGTTTIPYWIEIWSPTFARIWVRVPRIQAPSTTIYLYYGNPSATSESNGYQTFLFFDDFEGNTLNPQWDYNAFQGQAIMGVSDGFLNIWISFWGSSSLWMGKHIYSSYSLPASNIAIETVTYRSSGYCNGEPGPNIGVVENYPPNIGPYYGFPDDNRITMFPNYCNTSYGHTVAISGFIDGVKYQDTGTGANVFEFVRSTLYIYDTNVWYEDNRGISLSIALPRRLSSFYPYLGYGDYQYYRYALFDFVAYRRFVYPEPVPSVGAEENNPLYDPVYLSIASVSYPNITTNSSVYITVDINTNTSFNYRIYLDGTVSQSGTSSSTTLNLSVNLPHFGDNNVCIEIYKGSMKRIDCVNIRYVAPSTALWLSGWSYRKPIDINTPMNYPAGVVKLTIDTASLISSGKMNADCSDIRFTLDDGTTTIPYWIEKTCNTTNTIVWVKVPYFPARIYMYYGNPSATSESNGYQTFLFFDDFEGGLSPLAGWQDLSVVDNVCFNMGPRSPNYIETGGSISFSGSWINIVVSGYGLHTLRSKPLDMNDELNYVSIIRGSGTPVGAENTALVDIGVISGYCGRENLGYWYPLWLEARRVFYERTSNVRRETVFHPARTPQWVHLTAYNSQAGGTYQSWYDYIAIDMYPTYTLSIGAEETNASLSPTVYYTHNLSFSEPNPDRYTSILFTGDHNTATFSISNTIPHLHNSLLRRSLRRKGIRIG